MKILKYLGIFLLILLIIGFFLPKQIHVEGKKVINHDVSKAYNFLNDIKNWSKWSPWDKMDSTMHKNFGEITVGTGASYSWESQNKYVGKGSMKYTDCKENEHIISELLFAEGGPSQGAFHFKKVDGGTELTWSMDTDMGQGEGALGLIHKLIGGYMGIAMKMMMKGVFEEGLNNIDQALNNETSPITENPYKIEETQVPPFNAITVTGMMNMQNIPQKLGEYYSQCAGQIKAQKLEMAGAPFAFYHEFSPDKDFKVEAGIATKMLGKDAGAVKAKSFSATKAIVAYHYGPYEKTEMAHTAINNYILSKNLTIAGSPWEVYVNDPMAEPDSSKWLTEIYYPIK